MLKVMDNLTREDDRAVYGEKADASDEKKRAAKAAGVRWAVKEKARPGRQLSVSQRRRNRRFGEVRAKVEHVFRVVKCQFGYCKVRYRGIAKNGAQVFALLALANLFLARRPDDASYPIFGGKRQYLPFTRRRMSRSSEVP